MSAFTTILFTWLIVQIFYFGTFGPDFGFIKSMRPHHILAVMVGLAWLAAKASGQTVRRKFGWPERLMILLTLITTYSILTSGALTEPASIVDRGGPSKWLVCLFNMTYYPYMTYFCVRALPYTKEFLIRFLKLVCILGAYLAVIGVCEHYQWDWLVWPSYIMDPHLGSHFGRARGPFMESVAMGRVVAISFGTWLVLRIEGRPLMRAIALVIIPTLAVVEYFTQTRGPWIGFALICLAFIVYQTQIRKTLYRLGVVVLVVAACGVSSKFTLGEQNLFLERTSTVTDRIVTWITSVRMIEAHPIMGIGYGRFNHDWSEYYREGSIDMTSFDGSHNTYLTTGAEVGLPALLIWIAMGYLFWRQSTAVYKRLDPSRQLERNFIVLTIGTLWMYYFTAWFSDLKWTTFQNTVLFLMLGVVQAMGADLDENPPPSEEEEGMEEQPESEPQPMAQGFHPV